jgi:hypothetical protein
MHVILRLILIVNLNLMIFDHLIIPQLNKWTMSSQPYLSLLRDLRCRHIQVIPPILKHQRNTLFEVRGPGGGKEDEKFCL